VNHTGGRRPKVPTPEQNGLFVKSREFSCLGKHAMLD
jgi:hypothetical protein